VRQYPLNGTAIVLGGGPSKGAGYVFAGGAPLAVAAWANVAAPVVTRIDPAALQTYQPSGMFSHVRLVPIDGTFLSTKSGLRYRVAGGYAFALSTCSDIGGCPSPALVDAFAVAHPGTHLTATPTNGTVVLAEPTATYWSFANGNRSKTTASAGAIEVDDTSVTSFPIV
jgi:hypothetical protein